MRPPRERLYTTPLHFFQISTGLGAGNLGDELMARAFWQALPQEWHGDVEVFPMAHHYRGGYPEQHRYLSVHGPGYREAAKAGVLGLLAGGTPVHEVEGLHFPMSFIAERLDSFHTCRTSVHAVGVGVDFLYTRRARSLFQRSFLPIASWSVRNEDCRHALVDMGVEPGRIVVGADWAWLYKSSENKRDWAAEEWKRSGVDPARPIIAVNMVNLVWRGKTEAKLAIAEALDEVARQNGAQIAFFSNETRDGDQFDHAAAQETIASMRTPATLIPNRYWSIDEALGLLAYARVTLGMRYHFAIMTVLAGAVPVCIARSQKIQGLCADLGIEALGLRDVTAEHTAAKLRDALRDSSQLTNLTNAANKLRARAMRNLEGLASATSVVSRSPL